MLNELHEQIRALQLQLGDTTYNYRVRLEELDAEIAKQEKRRYFLTQERDAVSNELTAQIKQLVQKVRAIQEYEERTKPAGTIEASKDVDLGKADALSGPTERPDAYDVSANDREA